MPSPRGTAHLPSVHRPRPPSGPTPCAVQLGGMGFIHYNNTIPEQLANVLKVKRHIPGFVVTPAVLPPTATVADIEKLQVGRAPGGGGRGRWRWGRGGQLGRGRCFAVVFAWRLRQGGGVNPTIPCLKPFTNRSQPPQTARGFTSACVTDTGELGGRLLGIVTTRDVDFVSDRLTPISEIMTT